MKVELTLEGRIEEILKEDIVPNIQGKFDSLEDAVKAIIMDLLINFVRQNIKL